MAPPEGYVAIPGSEQFLPPGAEAAGPVNPNEQAEITLLLRPRAAAPGTPSAGEAAQRAAQQGRFLTREQFSETYGADPNDVAAVRAFVIGKGLSVTNVNAGARTVVVSGGLQALRDAFKVEMACYGWRGGQYRCRTGPVYVPSSLAGVIVGAFGFDNLPRARPHYRIAPAQAVSVSYTPVQVAQLYSFPANFNGAGESIGIIELGGGYTAQDLNTYFTQMGISPAPAVSAVSVSGGQNSPTGDPNGPDAEVMLDIEVAGSVAPGASIAVYFAPNTTAGFLNAVNTAVQDTQHKPSVISISWGGPESTWTAQDENAFNSAFEAAGTMGVTMCCASGDSGSSDGVSDGLAHVDFPASSPYALACGGTQLDSSSGKITSEVVWDDPNDGAGGGGVSEYFALPSYQANANVPPSVNASHFRGRGVPDVAGDADPSTGYQILADGSNIVVGGTSAVAPLWAGLIARLNQGSGRPMGFLNPALYTTISASNGAFRDVTSGNNGSYNAGPGWDPCTGWGSPDGSSILAALKAG